MVMQRIGTAARSSTGKAVLWAVGIVAAAFLMSALDAPAAPPEETDGPNSEVARQLKLAGEVLAKGHAEAEAKAKRDKAADDQAARAKAAAVPVPSVPAPVPQPAAEPQAEAPAAPLPLSITIQGPAVVVVGEPVILETEVTDDQALREVHWTVEPDYGFMAPSADRRQMLFTTSEAGEYVFSVAAVHKVSGFATDRFKVVLMNKPGTSGPNTASEAMADAMGDDPADKIRAALGEVDKPTPGESVEVASAFVRAANAADRGLLSPYNVLAEGKAMAQVALRRSGGVDRWGPFFDAIEELFADLDAEGAFKDPRARVGALRATAQVLLGQK